MHLYLKLWEQSGEVRIIRSHGEDSPSLLQIITDALPIVLRIKHLERCPYSKHKAESHIRYVSFVDVFLLQ